MDGKCIGNLNLRRNTLSLSAIGALVGTLLLLPIGGCDDGTPPLADPVGYSISGTVSTASGKAVSRARIEGPSQGDRCTDPLTELGDPAFVDSTDQNGDFYLRGISQMKPQEVCYRITVKPPEGLKGPVTKRVQVELRRETPYDEATVDFVLDSLEAKVLKRGERSRLRPSEHGP